METTLWVICTGLAVVLFVRWQLQTQVAPVLARQEEQIACRSFFKQREVLEAKFLTAATQLKGNSDVRILDCDWDDTTSFVRDRSTCYINAFVSFDIVYEVVPTFHAGEALITKQTSKATAIFHYEADRWQTQGKTLFDLSPENVTQQHQGQYEELQVAEGLDCEISSLKKRF